MRRPASPMLRRRWRIVRTSHERTGGDPFESLVSILASAAKSKEGYLHFGVALALFFFYSILLLFHHSYLLLSLKIRLSLKRREQTIEIVLFVAIAYNKTYAPQEFCYWTKNFTAAFGRSRAWFSL